MARRLQLGGPSGTDLESRLRWIELSLRAIERASYEGFNSSRISTPDDTMTFVIDSDGTPLTALTLAITDPIDDTGLAHIFDFGDTARGRLLIQTTNADADALPLFTTYVDAAAAVNDQIGGVEFFGNNADGDPKSYAGIYGRIINPVTVGREGRIEFHTANSGSLAVTAKLDQDGLKFFADTGAASALDDYEEGTFTPTLTTDDVNFTSVTADASIAGSYTKIGNAVRVSLWFRSDAVTIGSATGNVRIGGLPFSVVSGSGVTSCALAVADVEAWAGEDPISAFAIENSSTIELQYRTAVDGSTARTAVADVDTGTNNNQIAIGGTYLTA